ncbi:MAG: efflux RND transporter permease subunit [Nevskiaceae bacterium]|nr:MAG: efflux RND transporter permease subunit [Nevskiaceae bacterium]TBR71848.1 MAG: efflux RND transporter permease subunit [Nevskiaceae bacterium]
MKAMLWLRAHRRSILFLCAVLTAGGLFSAFSMPVSLFPNVAFPRVQVFLDAGVRPADQMALQVTRPVAEAVRDVRGVVNVRSTTSRGSSLVTVDFGWGTDMRRALLEVDAAISEIMPELPAGTRLHTRRSEPNIFPIISYSLRSHTQSLAELYDLAQYQLRPLLSSVPGVSQVQVQGGALAEYHVDVDPVKLRALNLSLADVTTAVSEAATIRGLGRLEDHYKLSLILASNQPDSVQALEKLVVRAGPGGAITLGSVARVSMGVVPQFVRVTADGQDAVLLSIYQQPDGNSVQIARDVRQRLADYAPQMPAGVKVANWYDQTQLVIGAAASVRDAMLIGILLAGLVLWAFLKNGRILLVALLDLPAVLAVTVLLLHVTHQSFNMMTLGGMAAAVGLILDDVIVMLEHIVRRLRDGTGTARVRIASAAWEFASPLTGSSAATIVIFVPLAFLSGVTGAFFKALSLTMAGGLLISWVFAFFAVPLLADWLLDERHVHEAPPGPVARRVQGFYERLLPRVLRRPWLILLGIVPLVACGAVAFTQVGSGFMPKMDEGGFILDYRAAPGTSLRETDRLLRQVEAIIQANPWVDTYSRRTGTQLGGGITESYEGDFFVRLKSGKRPPIEDVMNNVRQQVEASVPGLHIELAQLMEDVIGDLTSVPQPIEVKLYGDNDMQLLTTAREVAAAITQVPGIVDVSDGIKPAGDALEVQVDSARAALEGMTPASVAAQVANAEEGVVAAQLPEPPKVVGVRVWLPPSSRQRTEQVAALDIRAPDGHVFPLSRVATLKPVQGQPQITSENLKRMVAVTARIEGHSLGTVAAGVKATLNHTGVIPHGVYYRMGGLYAQQQKAFLGMTVVLAAAVALVFVLLLFLYEQFFIALTILAMPLTAMAAVFIGLWVTGIELDISSMMGMTMIVGIVTEIAIFYFSEFANLPASQPLEQRLLDAGRHRMRAILMSALAAILTLMPLALAIGSGARLQQPLAVAIIAGFIAAVPLVLVAMPGLYGWIAGRGEETHAD